MTECNSNDTHQSSFECMGCYEKITDYIHGIRTTKVEKKKMSRRELVRRTKIDSLLKVYNDLGTMKWIGADESWDSAIETVRKDLFNKIKNNLKKSDKVDLEQPITIYYKDK